jgi:hypothetical protein
MPAFSFEKIAPPAQVETSGPISSTVRRSAIVRFLDRLTSSRLQKSEAEIQKGQKLQKLKQKYRKQR